MKNSMECSKCGSKAILKRKGSPVMNSWSRVSLSLASLDIWVTKYICGDCGFIEEWIDKGEDIAKVKSKTDER